VEEVRTRSVEKGRTCTSVEGHSRARRDAGGDSLCFAALEHRARSIQQVAKLHNTSVKMIERHYAKYIATALEDLARAAVVSLVRRRDGNVVPTGKRA
jgi:hypothetical protein